MIQCFPSLKKRTIYFPVRELHSKTSYLRSGFTMQVPAYGPLAAADQGVRTLVESGAGRGGGGSCRFYDSGRQSI